MSSFAQLQPSPHLTDASKPFNERLSDFESLIGCKLPASYVRFLKKYDATLMFDVDVEYQPVVLSPWATKTGQQSLDVLCGLTKGREGLTQMYRMYGSRLPSSTIPIGCAPGGNVITLTLAGAHAHEVSLWDHQNEAAATGSSDVWGNIYLVSPTFEDFIKRLRPAKQEEGADKSSNDGLVKSRLSSKLLEMRRRELEGK